VAPGSLEDSNTEDSNAVIFGTAAHSTFPPHLAPHNFARTPGNFARTPGVPATPVATSHTHSIIGPEVGVEEFRKNLVGISREFHENC
jgi:hypothetical protein